jgi:hypothetical protein
MLKRTLMAVSLATVAVVLVLAGLGRSEPGASATRARAAAPPSPLLGFVSHGQRSALVRLDPDTLRPGSGGRVDAGAEGCASRAGGSACWSAPPWSFSPDRSRLALGRNLEGVAQSLRVVDVARMRTTADIAIAGGAIGLVAWPAGERLLAVQETCCRELEQLLVVDVAGRRVVARRPLGGTVLRAARTPHALLLLVAPARRVGPARLAVIDDRGAVRFAPLAQTPAGERLTDPVRFRLEQSIPGLAADPQGGHAYVVGAGPVADVDLASLAVSYHDLTRPISLLGRLRDWLDPAAYAKEVSGPTRTASWLGDGVLAVAGSDETPSGQVRPAGLSLIDTRHWSVRTIDRGATDVSVAGDLLLATSSAATGLTAYAFDGTTRFRAFDGRQAWIEALDGRRAYVGVVRPGATADTTRVLDLATGRATNGSAPPRLLLDLAGSWWDDP